VTHRSGPKGRLATSTRVRRDVGRWWRPGCVLKSLDFCLTSPEARRQWQTLFPSATKRNPPRNQDGRSASGAYTGCATGRVLISESRDESVTRWVLLLPVLNVHSISLYITQLHLKILYAIILSLYYSLHLTHKALTRMPFCFRCWVQLHQRLVPLVFGGASATRSLQCTESNPKVGYSPEV